jgi:hypothetical protein
MTVTTTQLGARQSGRIKAGRPDWASDLTGHGTTVGRRKDADVTG